MSANTTDKRTAIVLPTDLVKGITCAVCTDKNRAILNAFLVKGTARLGADGARHYELSLVATDSCELVELRYAYDLKAEPIDTPDEFEWIINPADKITGGNAPWCRIERIEDERGAVSYNVRTYKTNSRNDALARGMAIADMQPASYHVWPGVEGTYPKYEKLYPAKLTTVGNVSVSTELFGKVEKALTTAFGNKFGITLCGIDAKGAALEYAMYGYGNERVARAIIMPMRGNDAGNHYADKGDVTVNGADPAELETLRKAYEEINRLNGDWGKRIEELEAENAQLKASISCGDSFSDEYDAMELAYESKCKAVEALETQCSQLVALVERQDAEISRLESENAELKATWNGLQDAITAAVAPQTPERSEEPEPEPITAIVLAKDAPKPIRRHFVPEGCTVSVKRCGDGTNAWINDPHRVTKANSDALSGDGWHWAGKRQQWWRKVA